MTCLMEVSQELSSPNSPTVADDEYEVVIARHGTRVGRRSEAYLSYAMYEEPDGPITTDYYVWVIRNSSRTVLVDTGFSSAAAARRGREVLHHPRDIYRDIGVDVDHGWPVILTHAHWDHIGNLDLFPRSRFWMAIEEADFWATDAAAARLIAHFTEAGELAALRELRAQGRLVVFDSFAEIAPGIVVTTVGGHTPGQSMVTVRTRDGVVLLTSDVVHFVEELDRERPFVSVTDLPDMYAGFRTVKSLVSSGQVDVVVTGHDPSSLRLGQRVTDDIRVIGASGDIPSRT